MHNFERRISKLEGQAGLYKGRIVVVRHLDDATDALLKARGIQADDKVLIVATGVSEHETNGATA